MIRSALLLCGVIVAACWGCAPPAVPASLRATSATCITDPKMFLTHVQFIRNGYTPTVRLSAPPQNIGTAIDPNSSYGQNLQNAFLLAPETFRKSLCGLTGIYVNGPVDCTGFSDCISNSWGYRVWPTKQTYVVISAGLWNQKCPDGSAYVLHCFESDLLNTVLGWTGSNPPQYISANAAADDLDMTILAALAHEVGHVQWYQVMTPNRPGSRVGGYDPNTFCASGFFTHSWKNLVTQPPPWRVFMTRDRRNNGFGPPDLHLKSPQISDIDAAINTPLGAKLLGQLYQPDQPWASYFGAISPDEDFVETYKLYVLTSAQPVANLNEGPLRNLTILVDGSKHDIPGDLLSGKKRFCMIKFSAYPPSYDVSTLTIVAAIRDHREAKARRSPSDGFGRFRSRS
jgi:hypothetical protein